MNNKLFLRLKDLAQKENRARLAVLLGAAAMLLILLSELFTPSGKTAAASAAPADDNIYRQQLEQQLEQAVANAQYEQAAKLRDELRTLVRRQLAARRAQRTVSLTRQDIAAVVSERTGIPVGRLRQSDRERLLSLRQTLSQRIIGQQAAVDAVSTAVLRGRTGLADAGRPAASFLLIGPTGVGKTELCKQLAQVVYGSQDALIRVDMSEYMEPSSVSRLLGASGLCRLRRRRNAHGKGAPPSILRCTVR